jgi:hypothetical protein
MIPEDAPALGVLLGVLWLWVIWIRRKEKEGKEEN